MEPPRQICLFLLFFLSTVTAIPRQTASITTAASPATITQGPELRCSNGQSAVYTTDCTLGTPVSYCFSQEPPLKCSPGFFPSVWHPDHCMEQSTCFPLSSPWITTGCSNGAIPYSTSTLYDGTVAGGDHTIIKDVSCSCAQDQWSSSTRLAGASTYETFCMPHSWCPYGMTTSESITNSCTRLPPGTPCPLILETTDFCECAYGGQTPVYPNWPGAEPTGCEFVH